MRYSNAILFLLFILQVSLTKSNTNEDETNSNNQQRRKLQLRPYYYWYDQDVPPNGKYPELSCPLGTYRDFGNRNYKRPGGLRMEGCIDCPKGRYGNTHDLTNSLCTDACPLGTYLDQKRGTSIHDCKLCPEGTFGENVGLTTKECSGSCTNLNNDQHQYYSNVKGLTSRSECKICPYRYNAWQCPSNLQKRIRGEQLHHYEDPVENKRRWG